MNKELLVIIAYYGDPVGNLETQVGLVENQTSTLKEIAKTRILITSHDHYYHTADSDRVKKLIDEKTWGTNVKFITAAEGTFAVAYLNAYKKAITDYSAEYIVVMDSGLSHDPKDIPLFVEGLEKGADAVAGSRNVTGARNEYPWHRQLISQVGTFLSQNLLGLKLKDCTSGFIGYTRESMGKMLLSYPAEEWVSNDVGPYFLQTEERFVLSQMGLNLKEIPIQYGVLNEGRAGMLKPKVLWKAGIGLGRLLLKKGNLTSQLRK